MKPFCSGGRYEVGPSDTIASIANDLSTPGHIIAAYDILKYNVWVDPASLKPGSMLIVPTPRGTRDANSLPSA